MSADTVAPIIDRVECSYIIDRIYGASIYNGSKLLDIELATISFCARLSCWVGSARGDLLTSLHATSQQQSRMSLVQMIENYTQLPGTTIAEAGCKT